MLKDLVKVANRLDHLGLTKEADIIDALITKMAGVTRDSAPSVEADKVIKKINNMIEEGEAKFESEKEKDRMRHPDLHFKDYKWLGNKIQYMKSFLEGVNPDQNLRITRSPDGVGYQLWKEDPTDPKSKADPRIQGDGMSLSLSEEDLVSAIGEDHFNYIKRSADHAGKILAEVKQSGYGEWQFTGDVHELDLYGYSSEYLK